VKNAAFTRGHRREGEWLAGGANLLDSHLGHEVEFAIAGGLEAFSVEGDAVMVFGFEPEDLGGDVLNGEEKLTVSSEKERGVRAGKLDRDLGGDLGIGIGGGGLK
jgi:hypothetical protein